MTVVVSKKLQKMLNVDWNDRIQKALMSAGLVVQTKSSDLAPYDTGSLRRSIVMDTGSIGQLQVVIGSRLPYAKRRNYENMKNPQTRHYMIRGYTESKQVIDKIMDNLFR